MNHEIFLKRDALVRWSANILIGIVVISTLWTGRPAGAQQQQRVERPGRPEAISDSIERAVDRICEERILDRQGTIPIDEMALQNPAPLGDPQVIAGMQRAQRLLPVVKRLLPSSLTRLGTSYQSQPISRDKIISRVALVNTIKPDIELRDNATVRARDPHAIIFGTNFLAGLRSDEAMVAVLAHELTHVADGPDHLLQALFEDVAARVSQVSGMRIRARPAIELTCEIAGIQLVREYLLSTSESRNRQQVARALQKDCVSQDLADEAHLSPRDTLQLLLMLEPNLIEAINGAKKDARAANGSKLAY